MKGLKFINLPNGSTIIEGFKTLIVVDSKFIGEMDEWGFKSPLNPSNAMSLGETIPCTATPFITKKGRNAIRISNGYSHNLSYYRGWGDRSWNNFNDRKIINALFSEAVSSTNGGGCWRELHIFEVDQPKITAEQQRYMDIL